MCSCCRPRLLSLLTPRGGIRLLPRAHCSQSRVVQASTKPSFPPPIQCAKLRRGERDRAQRPSRCARSATAKRMAVQLHCCLAAPTVARRGSTGGQIRRIESRRSATTRVIMSAYCEFVACSARRGPERSVSKRRPSIPPSAKKPPPHSVMRPPPATPKVKAPPSGAPPNPRRPRLVRDTSGGYLGDLLKLFPDLPWAPRPHRLSQRTLARRLRRF